MKFGKLFPLIILAMCMVAGCSGTEKITQATIASEDSEFRKIKDLCDQEAEARCWEPVDSAPLYLSEIWKKRKQSKCKEDWIISCYEKYGYELQQ